MINTQLVPFAIPPILSAFVLSGLGIFVYLKNPKLQAGIFFSIFCVICAVWQAAFGCMNVMKNLDHAFFFSRVVYTAVIFIPVSYYAFVSSVLGLNASRIRRLAVYAAIGVVFELFLWTTRLFLSGNISYEWGYSSKADTLHSVFLVFFTFVFTDSVLNLYNAFKIQQQKSEEANRIKYLLLSCGIALIGSTDFLSTYGVNYYPLGFVFMIAFAAITAYAIIRHQLLDIAFAIKKSVLLALIFLVITILFTVIIMSAAQLSKIYLGGGSLGFTFFSILIASILFLPLYTFLHDRISRWLFKATAEELLETNSRLMEEIQRQNQMKAVSILAAGMAHEIKNPLTAIKTFAEYLPARSNDPEFIQKFQKIVTQETDRISGIIGDLLTFAKPSEPKRRPTDVNLLIRDTVTLLENQLHKTNTVAELNLTVSRAICNIDSDQIKQALLNIILNSIEAMSPSGGRVRIWTEIKRGKLEITIQDAGPGISTEKLARIFDPFFTSKKNGHGLGLVITKYLIEQNEGRIEVDSNQKGATFRLTMEAQA